MKLNGHLYREAVTRSDIKKFKEERENYLKGVGKPEGDRKRVYKVMGVSDVFVPDLESLLKIDSSFREKFNKLSDYILYSQNDLKIERLKFWIPTLAWAALTVSLFGAGANLAGQTNEEMAKIGTDLICSGVVSAGLGVYFQIMALLKVDIDDDICINENLQKAKAEARKMKKLMNEINEKLAETIAIKADNDYFRL